MKELSVYIEIDGKNVRAAQLIAKSHLSLTGVTGKVGLYFNEE